MYCKNCGNENGEENKFCIKCGAVLNEGSDFVEKEIINEQADRKVMKMQRIIGILYIVAGAILLLIGFADIDYDWGLISLCCGVGMLVAGILLILKKSYKAIHIIHIVFGGITLLLGLLCAEYDWGIIGMAAGISLLLVGILGLLRKSVKVIAIIEIVFGSILLVLWLACSEFDWGLTAMIAGGVTLVIGILKLANMKYIKSVV